MQHRDTGGGGEIQIIDQFTKTLSSSGSGGGVSLHFDADVAERYELDPDTEVVVDVVEQDGDVSFTIDGIPAGFTHEELENVADQEGWVVSDEFADEDRDEWFVTYRTESDLVEVEIDSEAHVDGNVMNNVVIRGAPVDVTGDFDRYDSICALAQRNQLNVSVHDDEGVWQRLRSAPAGTADDVGGEAPDRSTFEQLSEAAGQVTVRLVCRQSSINTALDGVVDTVRRIEDVYEKVEGFTASDTAQ
jgi:hypothetical protein